MSISKLREAATLSSLPLYATDAQLGKAILGKNSASWKGTVQLFEKNGFPKVNELTGGRYVPAVLKWFDYYEGVSSGAPIPARDGLEDISKWHERKPRRRPTT